MIWQWETLKQTKRDKKHIFDYEFKTLMKCGKQKSKINIDWNNPIIIDNNIKVMVVSNQENIL